MPYHVVRVIFTEFVLHNKALIMLGALYSLILDG